MPETLTLAQVMQLVAESAQKSSMGIKQEKTVDMSLFNSMIAQHEQASVVETVAFQADQGL